MNVRLLNASKHFNKEKAQLKKSIQKSLKKLSVKLEAYYRQGVNINQIFNDDSIKYDVFGSCYIFKDQVDSVQLRTLYSVFYENGRLNIILIDYHVKKANNAAYIKLFKYAQNLNINQVFKEAVALN